MRLDDLASQRELDAAQRRYFLAPKGQRLKRLAELRAVNKRILERDTARRKRGRG